MSEGYWKHDLTGGASAPSGYRDVPPYDNQGEAVSQPVGVEGIWDGFDTSDAAPEEPAGADTAPGAYWRGSYRMQGPSEAPASHHSGSVSASARRAYAAEALRQKDHVAAGLLAIFLGMFGVHKFYLGCNQTGFLMLAVSIIGGIFTLGLAAAVIEVIAVIEGVIYLSKSQTEFDQVYVLRQRDWF